MTINESLNETEKSAFSASAIITFVLAALTLSTAIFLGQSIAWFMEQLAIASTSIGSLSASGTIWFVVQAVMVMGIAGLFLVFAKNALLRPIYQGWFLAALLTFPALGLRFIGPNQDQPGALIQIFIGLIGGGMMLLLRRRSLAFNGKQALTTLAVIPFAIWPFLLWGSFGAPADIALNLVAGLALGLLAASLTAKTTGNFLLDGVGLSILLMILGTAFGYDGNQLLLMMLLPVFGFVLAALNRSVPVMVIGVGLVSAAPLMLIDPTELSIVLQDFFPWAFKISLLAFLGAMGPILPLWLLSKWQNHPKSPIIPALMTLVTWTMVGAVFFFFGQHGFHGDRLFVILKEQANLTPAAQIKDTGKRKIFVYDTLKETAKNSQRELRHTFDLLQIDYTPYYLVNAIEVDDSPLARLYLFTRPEVQRVIASPHLRPLPEPGEPMQGEFTSIEQNPGWNIKMIGADRVWKDFHVTGKGITVGQSDTGVDGKHPALAASYRGKGGSDDFNWYDPWNHSKSPVDGQGHGTHTLGTMLGQGGIGVAPDSQWIGCVNLARNFGNPAVYLDCMQFLFAPFAQNSDAFNGDTTQGAQVLNNSWGCPPIEGCDADALKPAADALRAAGVFVVVSAGNDGPVCSTINNPLSLYDSVFTVGAVDSSSEMAFFSSRGPVTVDGSGRSKPDIVAPGEDIFSSLPGGGYGIESGTSMAGPHLVGVVALLWSANPALIGDIDRTEQILTQTASKVSGTTQKCSTDQNTYGYGIVDVYAAVKMALGK